MSKGHTPITLCHEIDVLPDVCRLRFSTEPVANSDIVGDSTRGEMIVIHHNADGQIVSIELVGDGRACQESVH
ncbi:MAG: hypothetical protein ABI885_20905 [Gammaproteobacteria bacterium]